MASVEANPRRRALRALARADADFARVLEAYGPPPDRRRPAGFGTLLRAIVGQQVSAKAAASIWARLEARLGATTAEAVLAVDALDLRAVGLSGRKVLYARELAEAVVAGRFDFDAAHALDDEAAIAALSTLKGIGRWSAEVYLLFALGRPDVFPAGDLALQVAAQRLKRLRRRPTPERLRRIAQSWRPWRGVAAELLWHYYKHAPVV
ncbi:MAG: DNA-3-methyladenine glycosylase 2 family protein [Alphaproteobacteria bacterium]|nr:DNA-3-methyladenine glycosylase 2 family protein [Alphaproteobacteria bacterium]